MRKSIQATTEPAVNSLLIFGVGKPGYSVVPKTKLILRNRSPDGLKKFLESPFLTTEEKKIVESELKTAQSKAARRLQRR